MIDFWMMILIGGFIGAIFGALIWWLLIK